MQVLDFPAAPERSLQQRLDALAGANEIRTYRAKLKKRLKASRLDPVMVLLDPEQEIETMKVLDLLLAVPKVGRVKANKLLVQQQVSPSKTIGGLSPRQRAALAGAVGRYSSLRRETMAA